MEARRDARPGIDSMQQSGKVCGQEKVAPGGPVPNRSFSTNPNPNPNPVRRSPFPPSTVFENVRVRVLAVLMLAFLFGIFALE